MGVRGSRHIQTPTIKNFSEVEDFIKCSNDIWYFITTYVRIIHPTEGEIPFSLYGFQKAVLWEFLSNKYTITLKPRQMGMTTLVCAYVLWLVLFHSHKKVLLVSIKSTVAASMLRKVRNMYAKLPDHLKVEATNGVSGDKLPGSTTRLELANGSEVESSAATEDAGRSEALSLLVMDEVAFQRYASQIWASAQPTLSTGGQAILLSTAFGIGNFFHETYVNATQGLASKASPERFRAIKLNWRMHPDRGDLWYDAQVELLGKMRVAQEVDCDFLKSGYTVFDMSKIKAIEERLNSTVPLETFENGQFKIYHRYDPEKSFYVGADIASGRSRDFSTFSVIDNDGKEYACYKGKIGIREFGHLLMKVGYMYGQAVLAPEANAIGEGIVSVLQENYYPNIFSTVRKVLRTDEFQHDESIVQGWLTTGKSRHEIIQGMDDDLNDELIELWNPYFVQEAYTFVYNQNNKAIALGKELGRSTYKDMYEDGKSGTYTDDSILAACITNEVRKAPYRFNPSAISGG